MMKLRKLHRYLGVFFVPTIIFFAFSGALQTFGLHESARRGEPPPTAWIAALASVHKDQHLPAPPAARPEPAPAAVAHSAPAPAAEHEREHEKKSPLPLKLFILAMAIGLCVSALLGVYFALSNPRTRVETLVAVGLGALIPLLLLLM
jgi:hypothetical protein